MKVNWWSEGHLVGIFIIINNKFINWQEKEIALLEKKQTLINFKYTLYGSLNL